MLPLADQWPREEEVKQEYRLKGEKGGKLVTERSLAKLNEAVNKSIEDNNKI